MAYSLNPGDIVEITYSGTCFGQIVMNVFHFKYTGVAPATPGSTALNTLLAHLGAPAGFRETLLKANCPEYVMNQERAQVVYPTRQVYQTNALNLAGTFAGAAKTPNTAAVVLKQPDQAGRGRVGSVHIIAVPTANMVAGAWDAVYALALNNFANVLPTTQQFVNPGDALPVIWSRVRPTTPSTILSGGFNPYVRVEHRRTVGVGQ